MADVHSKETRSYNMSRIRSKDTKPELLVRKFLHKNGFRYRLHVKDMPGKPDIVLPKYKTVIFIHGCFWHGHEGCKKATLPTTRAEWWDAKIKGNIVNDTKAEGLLKQAGWKIITIWQCDLKKSALDNTIKDLLAILSE
ncbi:MAG: DNA mismatch endonuclease Vsr [Chitinophagaceae bacterium]|nr:MAG: DNA mismatch endonuclease Vsr [Chitinophagaceae bacterium]